MANKDFCRSMRFSEDLYNLINSQPGDTFSAKFEFLVRTCVDELPGVQKELANVRSQIESERKHLRVLRDQKATLAQNVNSVNYSLKALLSTVERANAAIESTGVIK